MPAGSVACGVLLNAADEIKSGAPDVQAGSNGQVFQLKIVLPRPTTSGAIRYRKRGFGAEFSGHWGPTVAPEAGEGLPRPVSPPNARRCLRPNAAPSSRRFMGLYPDGVRRQRIEAPRRELHGWRPPQPWRGRVPPVAAGAE